MIHSHTALLRHAQDFFAAYLVGLYRWDQVKISEPERVEASAPNVGFRERRRAMEAREGRGKFVEQVHILFKPWEIVIYSSIERPPLGEVILRDGMGTEPLVSGPLDAVTWAKIGKFIKSDLHQRRAS